MFFKNRSDAGERLAKKLDQYHHNPKAIVIGLPRGGIVTAYEIASALGLPLDVTCPRKIGAPHNPELAIGAITETGKTFFNEDLIRQLEIPYTFIKSEMEKERHRAEDRSSLFRRGRPPLNVKGVTVILVDDGLATGATMKAAIQSMKEGGAGKIVIAVPVASPHGLRDIEEMADEVVCLSAPPSFSAVGEFYEDFSQTEDAEVVELLRKRSEEGKEGKE